MNAPTRAMPRSVMVAALAAALALASCGQTTNPAACCTGPTDCPNIGLDQPQACATGLACVDNRCTVASCASTGCAADAPVCDTRSDTCQACTGPDDCAKYGAADQCNADTGACVECVAATDCGSTTPICDAGACRACRLDTDCDSGACGDDGACVPEAQIAYVTLDGAAGGPCDRAAPCRDIAMTPEVLMPAREHIVLAPGTYNTGGAVFANDRTTATRIAIHGHGAKLEGCAGDSLFSIGIPTTMRDLEIECSGEIYAILSSAHLVLERVSIKSYRPLTAGGRTELRDVRFESSFTGTGLALTAGASLELDRAVIFGGNHAITTTNDTSFTIKNLLAYRTSLTGLMLSGTGSVDFSTIADTGDDVSPGNGVVCATSIAIRSSIVWAPGFRAPLAGPCSLVTSIVGPMAVPGSESADPKFVDYDGHNFRLGPNSPARDMANTGPATDFEGDPRPQGARYDLGADESP